MDDSKFSEEKYMFTIRQYLLHVDPPSPIKKKWKALIFAPWEEIKQKKNI